MAGKAQHMIDYFTHERTSTYEVATVRVQHSRQILIIIIDGAQGPKPGKLEIALRGRGGSTVAQRHQIRA